MFRFQRALLIANPVARTVSPATLAVIEKALSADLKLDVLETLERGHATEVAREAVEGGEVELVIVFSGDGTINEVVNGLAGTDVALGVLPGGATNILVRALGLPLHPVGAPGPPPRSCGGHGPPDRPGARRFQPPHRPRMRRRPLLRDQLRRRPRRGRDGAPRRRVPGDEAPGR